ncbi:MAG: aryl-sulfate sulfotransferase [Pseudomonadota bacterium]
MIPPGSTACCAVLGSRASTVAACLLVALASACSGRQQTADASAPVNLYARAVSPFHAEIGWEPTGGGNALYQVQRRTGDGPWMTRAALPEDEPYFLDLGLLPETRYFYRVGAARAGAPILFSEDVAVETPMSFLPQIDVRVLDAPLMQPGVTVFSIEDPDYLVEFAALVAVDDEGNVIWMIGDERFFVITDFDFAPDGTIIAMVGSALEHISMSAERLYRYDKRLLHHDIDVTPWGTTLAIAGYGDRSADGTPHSADAIVEFDLETKRETGAWPLREAVPFEDICVQCFFGEDYFFGHDWTHLNALLLDPDFEHLYLSVRNLNRIYKISYSTGLPVWVMGEGGDFGQGLFFHQHEPELVGEGRMLLFDNGLHRAGTDYYSRAIEVRFDAENKAAEVVWEYREKPDFFTGIGGDADRLANGNTLITDSINARIIEVAPDGQVLWELKLPLPYRIYKAIRLERFPPAPAG